MDRPGVPGKRRFCNGAGGKHVRTSEQCAEGIGGRRYLLVEILQLDISVGPDSKPRIEKCDALLAQPLSILRFTRDECHPDQEVDEHLVCA